MPKLYVKQAGTWKQVLQLYVKQSGIWKGVTTGLVTQGGIGKQFYPDTISTTTYSAAGSYSYTVPAGVTTLQITYPTLASVVTTNVTVTPGSTYAVTIGGYGSGSSFGALLSTAGYTKTIGSWSGNVDAQIYVVWGVGTASGNTYSGGGYASDLSSGAAAAGCYYSEYGEGSHGDLYADITINTALSATFVNTLQASITNFSGRGGSSAVINTQPDASNSYRTTVYAQDGGYSEGTQSWNVQLQQIVSLQIKAIGANFQNYSAAGTYSFTVPAGVTSLTMPLLVAGGGGGGGSIFSGDGHGAANGGSGGYYSNQTISVTPGETLTLVIGAGGTGVSTGGGTQGGRGGTSSISRGATVLFSATGGYGGNGVTGDNAPNNTSPANGSAGGSPSGVAGSYQASWMVNRNTSGQGLDGKGTNGTGYGTGGLGGNSAGGGAQGGTGLVGGTGYISLTW